MKKDSSFQLMASSFVSLGGELHLSNQGQLELLRGMMERGVSLRTSARGFSMAPFIHDEDVLTIAPLKDRMPHIGEVVAFTWPDTGKLVIHRVIRRVGDAWLVRGDNGLTADGLVARENILGAVMRIQRNGREVQVGLGAERVLIALLQRANVLTRLVNIAWRIRRILMSFRIILARRLISLGRLVQSLAVMIMSPDDLVEFSRQTYARPNNVASWASEQLIREGLNPEETALVEQLPAKDGKLLLLGVGGGREAIPLAQMGFDVTGTDFVSSMIEAAKANAERAGVQIHGFVQELSRLEVPPESYDVVWLSARMYSCIPTRIRRVEFLQRVHRALRPGGHFFCQFYWGAPEKFSSGVEWVRRAFSIFTLGNRAYEPGDALLNNIEFIHGFQSEDELRTEFAAGGFHLAHLHISDPRPSGQAVLVKDKI
jgi:SAM-dependent methyltransferase